MVASTPASLSSAPTCKNGLPGGSVGGRRQRRLGKAGAAAA